MLYIRTWLQGEYKLLNSSHFKNNYFLHSITIKYVGEVSVLDFEMVRAVRFSIVRLYSTEKCTQFNTQS
jgi:hypothetical protein